MAACSVVMEATRPTPVDLNYFQTGMTRDQVLDKLGAPDGTAIESDGASCDFYKLYTRGYGAGGKVPIAVAEAAADAFTLGLAEIALTPTEGVTRNEKHPVQFCYHGQTLVRIKTETPPTAQPVATLAAGQNPPITAAQSEASDSHPSAGIAAIPTFAPSPAPAVAPSTSRGAGPTPGKTWPQIVCRCQLPNVLLICD
jgi:hypothetical protein